MKVNFRIIKNMEWVNIKLKILIMLEIFKMIYMKGKVKLLSFKIMMSILEILKMEKYTGKENIKAKILYIKENL